MQADHFVSCQPLQGRPRATQAITRGVLRLLVDLGYAPITELSLGNGRRVDVLGLDKKGRSVVVEVKSSVADYRSDKKWAEYLDYCEEFYFAVDTSFPLSLFDEAESLPQLAGVIVADAFGAEIIREAVGRPLNGNRKKALTLKAARAGAMRLSSQMLSEGYSPSVSTTVV